MQPDRETTADRNANGASGASVEIVRSPTEGRNSGTYDIDVLPTIDVLREINAEDATAPSAVAKVLPDLAHAVDLGVDTLRDGGRIHYFGAGTSGRISTMDAAELPPTFGIVPGRVVSHHAGGETALGHAVEGIEDDLDLGRTDAAELTSADLAVCLAASGRTPYVAGALRRAHEVGARTVLISANPAAPLAGEADVHVGMDTGAEVIAGSTRMKAGTAQKLAINAFSTAVMVRLGYTYSNLMVGMNATNAKLRGRMVTILMEATGCSEDVCADALADADGDTRVALVSLLGDVDSARAGQELAASGGHVRGALRRLGTAEPS
ncbi:N-acetylmuramic acid 6-phosphate etherase [Lipingzhangella halophila]|uniref:N-acetylmuramic acid 6-phosphate etherase n=1 Tax=Lipingzhangella halophila TaxID=1783352 RepID=A0A7W7REP9_9ACTN|nr:N-acetylmuramic acid 6-phosphate etherase [Lipingzhangella halophila]MBB4930071.1 N-acetylmuramic acid 6-phosphate etherase [Lipingzhangella halophila]